MPPPFTTPDRIMQCVHGLQMQQKCIYCEAEAAKAVFDPPQTPGYNPPGPPGPPGPPPPP